MGIILLVAWLLLTRGKRWLGPKTPTAVELNRRLEAVRYMSGPQFEVFVADVLRAGGYRTSVLGGSGDQGVDVIAIGNDGRIAIQCKNYAKPVGNRPVQEVYAGARHHGCSKAMVVAPMGFTKGAVALAKSVGVDLHNSNSLREWIRQIDRNGGHQANFEPRVVDLDEIDRRKGYQTNVEPHVVDLDGKEKHGNGKAYN